MSDLTVRDLTIEYSSGGFVAHPIDHLSLDVPDGRLVLLLGASGCGKTTLLSALASLLRPRSGTITLGNLDVTALSGRSRTAYRRHTVGVVFQAFNLVPSLSALENVAAPLLLAGERAGTARRRAATTLEQVGLADRATHRPAELSGGQQQRVAIARALVHDPTLILADEPTAHLDYIQVEGVLSLLRSLARPGRIVVVATHDERLLPLADAVIELTAQRAPADRPPRTLTLAAGEVLFEQGDQGDLVYLVERGEIEIVRQRADGTTELVTTVGPGGYFGELAPLFRMRRSATSRATVATTVTGLTPHDFRRLAAREHRPRDAPPSMGLGVR